MERYTVRVRLRNWDAMGVCFHEDGVWRTSPPFNLEFRTREAIQEGISSEVNLSNLLVQMSHGVVIDDLTEDTASATVIINEIGRRDESQLGLFLLGVYRDTITRKNGQWKFQERYFEAFYVDRSWRDGTITVDYDN